MTTILMARRRGGASGGGGPNYAALPAASLANLQTVVPDWSGYIANMRNAPAGTSWVNPSTGVRMVKITDATTPSANGGSRIPYGSGGPHISLPLDGTGKVSVSLSNRPLFDITPGGGPTNWRTPVNGVAGDLTFAFSRNPSTPWRAYQVVGSTLHRINHVTNTADTGDGFPYDLTGLVSGTPQWLSVADNDTAIVFQTSGFDPSNVIKVTPSTATLLAKSRAAIQAAVGSSDVVDEVIVTDDGRYVFMSFASNNGYCVWDTVTNFVSSNSTTTTRGGEGWSHQTPIGGSSLAAQNPSNSRQNTAMFTAVPVTSNGQTTPAQTNLFAFNNESVGFNHNSSTWGSGSHRWIVGQALGYANFNNPALRGAWSVHSGNIYVAVHGSGGYGSEERGVTAVFRRSGTGINDPYVATVRRATSIADMTEDSWWYSPATDQMYVWQLGGGVPDARYEIAASGIPYLLSIGAIRSDGLDQRVITHHYTMNSAYDDSAFPHQSADGRWIIWSTNHGVPGGRADVLMAEIP